MRGNAGVVEQPGAAAARNRGAAERAAQRSRVGGGATGWTVNRAAGACTLRRGRSGCPCERRKFGKRLCLSASLADEIRHIVFRKAPCASGEAHGDGLQVTADVGFEGAWRIERDIADNARESSIAPTSNAPRKP